MNECVDLVTSLLSACNGDKFNTILADPPWRFDNRYQKNSPEYKNVYRYSTLGLNDIKKLPVNLIANNPSHLYLWVPNALLLEGLEVMKEWGFQYKNNLIWHKIRKDGGPDGRGLGHYFRNTTEIVLFGIKGKKARTLPAARSQVNFLATRKREHSRKPDEMYEIIERCSPWPYLELFARGERLNWRVWGNEANKSYRPTWVTYHYNSTNA